MWNAPKIWHSRLRRKPNGSSLQLSVKTANIFITAEERRALLDRAITTYGAPAQMDMAVEEMAELTKALCKIKRAQAGCEVTAAIGNVIEEMADVQIMLDQLRIIFHRSTEEVEEAKLERLKNRLDGRNNWQGSSLHKWIEKQFSTGGDGHE